MARRGNGEGTIYFSDRLNRWCGQVTIGYKDDGNLNRKSVYGKTRNEVKNKILELQTKPITEKSKLTVYELAKEIVEDKLNNNQINENTYKRNLYTLGYIENSHLACVQINKVYAQDIKMFLSSLTNYSNSVISKTYQLLNKTFKRAVDRNIIARNPMDFEEVVKPKSDKRDKEVQSLSVDEEKRFIEALEQDNSKYNNLLLLMLFTGIRIGEALALSVTHIEKVGGNQVASGQISKRGAWGLPWCSSV